MRKHFRMKIAVITGQNITPDDIASAFAQVPDCRFYKTAELVEQQADAIVDLSFTGSKEQISVLKSFLPRIVLVNSVLDTITEINAPFIRFNGWPGFLNNAVKEVCVPAGIEQQAADVFEALQWKVIPVPDICGFTSICVISMIINEAFFAYGEGVSTKEEIDTAMKLGTNYPYGPFEWCNLMGIEPVYTLLKKLSLTDLRYTPAPELEKEAAGKIIA